MNSRTSAPAVTARVQPQEEADVLVDINEGVAESVLANYK
jgi:hypothetical protein